MLSKIMGTNNKLNNAIAAIQALAKYKDGKFEKKVKVKQTAEATEKTPTKKTSAKAKKPTTKKTTAKEKTEE